MPASQPPSISRRVALVVCAGLLVACADNAASTPNDTLRNFARATADNDQDRAASLFADPPGDFSHHFDSLVAAGADYVNGLRSSSEATPSLYATVPVEGWQPVQLALRDGQWQIVSGVADEVALSSPRATALAFARAWMNADYDALREVVPPEFRDAMTDEVLQRWRQQEGDELEDAMRDLRDALDAEIIVQGSEAYLPTSNYTLRLIRVEDRWYVFDFM